MQPAAPAEILAEFARCATPSPELLEAGARAGIPWRRMMRRVRRGDLHGPRLARVVPIVGERFEFAEHGEDSCGALIFVACDAEGFEIDLVAWRGHGAPLRWLASADLLGAENLQGSRGLDPAPLVVHFEVEPFLLDACRGVLVLDDGGAIELLRDVRKLVVDRESSQKRLEAMLRRVTPEIAVAWEVEGVS